METSVAGKGAVATTESPSFYDLAKSSVTRMAFALAHELQVRPQALHSFKIKQDKDMIDSATGSLLETDNRPGRGCPGSRHTGREEVSEARSSFSEATPQAYFKAINDAGGRNADVGIAYVRGLEMGLQNSRQGLMDAIRGLKLSKASMLLPGIGFDAGILRTL